jgi:hypothetical protein
LASASFHNSLVDTSFAEEDIMLPDLDEIEDDDVDESVRSLADTKI